MTEQQGQHRAEDVDDNDVTPVDPPEDLETAESAESNDEEDVKAALEKNDTEDGKGGAVVPSADFDSFAADDVENDDGDQDNTED
jgi:hypothetical protein